MSRVLMLLLLGSACDDSQGGGHVPDLAAGLHSATSRVTSNGQGLARVSVDASGGVDAFLVTGITHGYLALETIEDPDGYEVFNWEDWYDADENLTWAIFPMASDTVVNWPVRDVDGPLDSGTWTVWLATIDSTGHYASGVDVDLTVQRKVDPSLSQGTVRVLIAWADGVSDDPDVVDATEQAVDLWAQIWGAYGLDIDVRYVDSAADPDLVYPVDEGSDYGDVSALGDDQDITVIVGETIDGNSGYYGVSGSIPGTLVVAPRSVITVSWLANSGADGVFSQDDIRLYGETLAHESGHYLGLFHPVEMSWDMYDALDDTPRCAAESRCETDLGDNLMFPYPVCGMVSCEPQQLLTDEQVGVGQRYTGAL